MARETDETNELQRISSILSRLAAQADRSAREITDRQREAREEPQEIAEAAPLPRAARTDLQLVEALFAERRRRDSAFGGRTQLLGEPAWDMLLYLFIGALRGWAVSITHATQASGVPATSALRYIGRMEDEGLLTRAPDPMDRRRTLLTLTDTSRRLLADYIASLRTILL